MILAVAIAFVTFEICNLLTSCGMVMAAHAKKDRTLELASHSTVRGKTSGQAKREHHGMLIRGLLNTL